MFPKPLGRIYGGRRYQVHRTEAMKVSAICWLSGWGGRSNLSDDCHRTHRQPVTPHFPTNLPIVSLMEMT